MNKRHTITEATAADLEEILRINQAHVPHVGSTTSSWFSKYLSEAFYFKVLRIDNKVAGFLLAMLPSTDYESENFLWFKKRYDSFVYVDRIAIDSTYHGNGFGRALYHDLENEVKARVPLITCEVNVRPLNQKSLDFHKSLGFKELGQQETKNASVRVSLLGKEF